MSNRKSKYPKCFGHLETVFPMGEDGLRHTPAACLECLYKTECLRTAIQGREGLKVREEHVDRAYDSGMIGFLERWSRKKSIQKEKRMKTQSGLSCLLTRSKR
jgi:hypothetical protein